jgi:hypothetical protein
LNDADRTGNHILNPDRAYPVPTQESPMKIVRSIAAVVLGWILGSVVTGAVEMANFVIYAPTNGKPFMEWAQEMMEKPEVAKAWIESLPTTAMLIVLAAWELGAFIGGGVSALIAGRARLIHAGVVGLLVLVGTIRNDMNMKRDYDFSHPDWMMVLGVILPVPMALLAGLVVSWTFPGTPVPATEVKP